MVFRQQDNGVVHHIGTVAVVALVIFPAVLGDERPLPMVLQKLEKTCDALVSLVTNLTCNASIHNDGDGVCHCLVKEAAVKSLDCQSSGDAASLCYKNGEYRVCCVSASWSKHAKGIVPEKIEMDSGAVHCDWNTDENYDIGSNVRVGIRCAPAVDADCEIDWIGDWSCYYAGGFMRKGILRTSSSGAGRRCEKVYDAIDPPLFSRPKTQGDQPRMHCQEDAFCLWRNFSEHAHTDCSTDVPYARKCQRLARSIRKKHCNSRPGPGDNLTTVECGIGIQCYAAFTHSGGGACECRNWNTEVPDMIFACKDETNLERFELSSEEGAGTGWICSQNPVDGEMCSYSCAELTDANCTISGPVFIESDSFRTEFWRLLSPHGVNGNPCRVDGKTVVCSGHWCTRHTMKDSCDKQGMYAELQEESAACVELTKSLGYDCNRRCIGCFPMCMVSCIPALDFHRSSSIRQCQCINAYLSSNSYHVFDADEGVRPMADGWRCTARERNQKPPAWRKGGPDWVASELTERWSCSDASNRDCEANWTEVGCQKKYPNAHWTHGELIRLGGENGKRCKTLSDIAKEVNCLCGKCDFLFEDWSCPPWRGKTKHGCLCQVDWKAPMQSDYVSFQGGCDETHYGGCCNPAGDRPHPYCPIKGNLPQPKECQFKDCSAEDGIVCDKAAMQGTYDKCDANSTKLFGACAPWWHHNRSSPCPFGRALPGQVTLPYSLGFGSAIAIFYGYVPYGFAVFAGCEFLYRRTTRTLSFILFVCVALVLGEIIFKRIVQNPRPPRSCLLSCGMPSTHSTLSIGYFVLMFLDAIWRLWKQGPAPLNRGLSLYQQWKLTASAVPLLDAEVYVSAKHFILWVGMWAGLLVPVPAARVILNDHTLEQVVWGSLIGSIEAICWFALLQYFKRQLQPYVGKTRYGVLHDYSLPNQSEDNITSWNQAATMCHALSYHSSAPLPPRFGDHSPNSQLEMTRAYTTNPTMGAASRKAPPAFKSEGNSPRASSNQLDVMRAVTTSAAMKKTSSNKSCLSAPADEPQCAGPNLATSRSVANDSVANDSASNEC